MHPLLAAQLQSLGLSEESPPDAATWRRFVAQLDRALGAGDQDRSPQRALFFSHCPIPCFLYDPITLRILDVSDVTCAVYGYSRDELLAMTITALRPPDEAEEMIGQIRRQPRDMVRVGVRRHLKKDGAPIDVDITAQRITVDGREVMFSLCHDVTMARRLERQIVQAQKMDAVGCLAGGIAHDFNNVLAAILSYADLAASEVGDASPAAEDLREIVRAAQRAASLTQQLLTFSRHQPVSPRPVSLAAIARDMLAMLQRVVGEAIRVSAHLDDGGADVEADPGQLQQVVLNLAANARDAMPNGGELAIDVARSALRELEAAEAGVAPGDYVRLTVRDEGCGIDGATKARIFEPFFTTKEVGKGTGLGLAIVFSVVKQAGGGVRVESSPGAGARFDLFFPRAVAAARVSSVVHTSHTGAERRRETVLLVEDDDAVRRAMRRVLAARGYVVLEAPGPEAALALARDARFDVVVSDIVMPDMDGRAMVRLLREARPDLRVVFVSGYAAEDRDGGEPMQPGDAFLQKPFTPSTLVGAISAALSVSASESGSGRPGTDRSPSTGSNSRPRSTSH